MTLVVGVAMLGRYYDVGMGVLSRYYIGTEVLFCRVGGALELLNRGCVVCRRVLNRGASVQIGCVDA